MNDFARNRWLAALAVAAFGIAACGKGKSEDQASESLGALESLTDRGGLLQYVPADTPYVFANTQSLPDEFMDKMEPVTDQLLTAYREMLERIGEQALEDLEADEPETDELETDDEDRVKAERAFAVIGEVASLMSIEGLRAAGITRDSRLVFYGNGLLPVLRMELSDAKRFDATIERFEEQADARMSVAEIGSQTYRYVDTDAIKFIVATIGNQAVVTLSPVGFGDEEIGALLGLSLPQTSIAESGELLEIAEKYGYSLHYLGLVSTTRIAETFLADQTGINAALFQLMDASEKPELSEVCRNEIRAAVEIAPRIAMGYDEFDTERLSSSVIVELRGDIASGLTGLAAPVPGLGVDHGGMMSLGFSLNPLAAREFYEARLDAMEAAPYECELFAELQAGVEQGRAALQQPVPPMIYDFRGLLAVIDNMDGYDFAQQKPPEILEARAMLAMENANNLIMMGGMMVPALAELQLEPDGEPVALDPAMLAGTGIDQASVALTENALAIAVGEDTEAGLAAMLGAETVDPAPFFSMNMDAVRYFEFIRNAGEAQTRHAAAGLDDGSEEYLEATQAAQAEVLAALQELYDRILIDVYFTDNGIEMRSVVILRD